MSYKISKELFEAVMNLNTSTFTVIEDEIQINAKSETDYDFLPVDTFFFKCKKWALIKGYEISSKHNSYFIKYGKNTITPTILYTSEQQAVFDACEWVRKELLK